MEMHLKDKVAIVTGGSVGIGLAVAQGLAREGVHLVLCARNAERVAAEAAAIAQEFWVQAIGVQADVALADDIDRVIAETSRQFGGADILINNAGTGSNETVMDAPDEKWQYYWDLHMMAAVRLARGVVPFMRQRGGGVILQNASICAKVHQFSFQALMPDCHKLARLFACLDPPTLCTSAEIPSDLYDNSGV